MADHVLARDRVLDGRGQGRERKVDNNRGLLIALGILLVVAAGEAAFHLFVAPQFVIKHIEVSSDGGVESEAVIQAAGLSGKVHFFALQPKRIEGYLRSLPLVRAVRVEKVFPDRLRIHVETRRPLVLAIAETSDGVIPVAIDENGLVFREGSAMADFSLPVISGLRFEGRAVGTRLPGEVVRLLESLSRLKKDAPALFNYFSEFRLQKSKSGLVDVIAYPVSTGVPVRMALEIDEELCRAAVMVIDVMKREGFLDRVTELDFRGGEIVYRMRED